MVDTGGRHFPQGDQLFTDSHQSIDLTRLPAISMSAKAELESGDAFEYSSREVSPPALLLQQMLTAHRIFLLHHGPSLQDLFTKIKREAFCSTLDRYWSRFCKDWEVLLHGNPAVDVFGGLKLSSGGELGIGVGEEEWGSGEREVLEDLTRNTEGLVDLTVSRFGEAASDDGSTTLHELGQQETTAPSWLGCGHLPEAHDGVIFGGIGQITRASLRDISAWVQQIYTYGEHAYGVQDNPRRQRRKRQRRKPPVAVDDEPNTQDVANGGGDLRKQTQKAEARRRAAESDDTAEESDLQLLPKDPRPQMHETIASHDHATYTASPQVASHPGIPPPIVTAAEQSLNKAVAEANVSNGGTAQPETPSESTYGISDKWMKYLTLGLSSGKSNAKTSPRTMRPGVRRGSTSSSTTLKAANSSASTQTLKTFADVNKDTSEMTFVDPMPEGHAAAARLAHQKQEESSGYFMIGYRGALDEPADEIEGVDGDIEDDDGAGERTLLRTLQVERSQDESYTQDIEEVMAKRAKTNRTNSTSSTGDSLSWKYQRLRVVVYIRRPFVYTFLFEQRAPGLGVSEIYKNIHHHLMPLQKPMLSNTSVAGVARRLAETNMANNGSVGTDPRSPPYEPPTTTPVFDMVYDPLQLTIHTSIPNIPHPGTMAAEGIGTTSSGRIAPPAWTRVEGLNVHSQILNTLESTKSFKTEAERTSKTSRGWWIVWMRVPPSRTTVTVPGSISEPDMDSYQSQHGRDREREARVEDCRIAFLVRKASDWVAPKKSMGSRASSAGMFGFGASEESSQRSSSNNSSGWAPGSLAGGIGIDARRYVEGLLSLNR